VPVRGRDFGGLSGGDDFYSVIGNVGGRSPAVPSPDPAAEFEREGEMRRQLMLVVLCAFIAVPARAQGTKLYAAALEAQGRGEFGLAVSLYSTAILSGDLAPGELAPADKTLYALRDDGTLQQLARGLYRLASLPPVGDPDLALVAGRIPKGVVCLISALAIHELTTQIPHEVHLAIPRSARYPVCDDVPLTVYRFGQASFAAGLTERDIGGLKIRVFNAEKSIADCFKYRNKIGLDIVLEALATYRKQRGASMQRILEYARVNRVEVKIRPYLEAVT